VSSTLPNSQVTELSGNQVRFTLQGDASFTYVVTASSTAEAYTFSGTLRDEDRNDRAVGGSTTVTVQAAQQADASASRSFDPATVEPGGRVTVTITVANYGQLGGVTETLPTGFSYVSSSLDDSQVDVSGQTAGFSYVSSTLPNSQVTELSGNQVRFTLQGDTSFTYVVTASSTTGTHTFSGMLRDFERANYTVVGDTEVTVEASTQTPMRTEMTVRWVDLRL
jgi:uncharacterized repeat protein (TIGR01451 family)